MTSSLRLLFVGFCAFVLAFPVWGQDEGASAIPPGDYILGGVRVTGNQFTESQSVVILSGLSLGRRITIPGADISKAITKLWKQDIFSDVQVQFDRVEEGNQLFLVIAVTERPRISRYDFKGVKKGNRDDLREKIRFVPGTLYTEGKRRSAERVIKNFFQEKGYLNTQVDIETRPDTLLRKNGVAILMKVKRGPKVKIRNIEIEGNSALSDKTLRKQLKKTKRAFAGRFWKRSKFVRGDFNEDKEKLAEFFSKNGYRDAELISDSVKTVNSRRVDLRIKMIEGKKYYFRQIGWAGNYKYESSLLNRLLEIKRGDIYDTERLNKRLSGDPQQDVASLYQDDGHLFFRAEPVETRVDGDSVDIEVRMFEGPQATIDKIILEGNDKTSDHVILREIRTLPGNKFSRSELIRSQREILNLGFFDQQKMNIVPIPDPQRGTVDLKYVVEERSNDQIMLQGGYGGRVNDINGRQISGGLLLTVGLTFNNFATRKLFDPKAWRPLPSGDGQRLTLQVQTNGQNFQNYGISFLEPWFGGKKPNSLGFNTNYSIQSSPEYQTPSAIGLPITVPAYRLNIVNFSVDYGRRLTWPDDFFRSFTTLRYSHYDLLNASRIFPAINTGTINILSVRQTIDRTSIDAPIFSRSGSVFTLTAEGTVPWSLLSGKRYRPVGEGFYEPATYQLLEFWKVKFDTQLFLPITRSAKLPLVAFLRARGGFLGAYDRNRTGIAPVERFYLGGDGIVGFNLDGREIIALRGYGSPALGDPNFGNTSYIKYTFELRQPITLEQSAMIWVHSFAEAGNAWGQNQAFNPFVIKRSAGFGLRAFLPQFGLLGIDWGYGFDNVQSNGTNIGASHIHFIIGQQF
jgi:outer membrane protein insertion porin family